MGGLPFPEGGGMDGGWGLVGGEEGGETVIRLGKSIN